MNSIGNDPGESLKLLPHQSAFVEKVFDPATKRLVFLCGDVGLGKSAALVAVAARIMKERPGARVLILVPALSKVQYLVMLREAGVMAIGVDRFQFRVMLDAMAGGELWPRGAVTVLSRDFAKKPDILESLTSTHWNLVIADDAHSLSGPRATEVLRRVGNAAERVVLATLPGLQAPSMFPPDDMTTVEWRRDQIVDREGKQIVSAPRAVLDEVTFSLSNSELSLLAIVEELCRVLEGGTSQQTFGAQVLRRVAVSSPAALERALRNLIVDTGVQNSLDGLLDASDENEEEDGVESNGTEGLDVTTAEKANTVAVRAIQDIEALGSDSKLGAFNALLSRLAEAEISDRRICVMTQYVGTLYYLAAAIEDRGVVCRIVHGGVGVEDRKRSLTAFQDDAGILLATNAILADGTPLGGATDLVLYDVPHGKVALQEVRGRFDRFGRSAPLNIHVLIASNAPGAFISEQLRVLRDCFVTRVDADAELRP